MDQSQKKNFWLKKLSFFQKNVRKNIYSKTSEITQKSQKKSLNHFFFGLNRCLENQDFRTFSGHFQDFQKISGFSGHSGHFQEFQDVACLLGVLLSLANNVFDHENKTKFKWNLTNTAHK